MFEGRQMTSDFDQVSSISLETIISGPAILLGSNNTFTEGIRRRGVTDEEAGHIQAPNVPPRHSLPITPSEHFQSIRGILVKAFDHAPDGHGLLGMATTHTAEFLGLVQDTPRHSLPPFGRH